MDFYKIRSQSTKKGVTEVYPDFLVRRSKDLMIKGGKFYAVWDEDKGLWSTDEYDVQRIIDKDLYEYADSVASNDMVVVKDTLSFRSRSWDEFKKYTKNISDNYKQLDDSITFADTEVDRTSYVSKRLPYPLKEGDYSAYDELMNVLYEPEERQKLEWSIGAIISGDSKKIQKFIVLYGPAGAGKSTVLNIIQQMFEGYYATFEAKSLTSNNNQFSTEAFKDNPLIAIQHDGDLSRIEDNSKLNSIVSHELIEINEKHKNKYSLKLNAFLYMGTNKPVKITDSKSGIIRRLIDVKPTGNTLPASKYTKLMKQIDYELGAIAYHCLQVYEELGKNYYDSYRPIDMMFQTDPMYNFVESQYFLYSEEDSTTLKQAFAAYKEYCQEVDLGYSMPMYKFREELKSYFKEYYDRKDNLRSVYEGFLKSKFERTNGKKDEPKEESKQCKFIFSEQASKLDEFCKDWPAQYASKTETPSSAWSKVTTTLKDIDTHKLHYMFVPEKFKNLIMLDFDIRDENGNKSLEKNLEAASQFPLTYGELSKSGGGIHLYYIYTGGDPSELASLISEHVEVKAFPGNSSIRRLLTKCNDVPIAEISSGLPKKETKMIAFENVKNEKAIRTLIKKNLRKEIHPGTKPSIDFIFKILEDAYNGGVKYDVSDMKNAIMAFAANSTNQADYCLKLVTKMHFQSDEPSENSTKYVDDLIIFYDVEVFPNLFLVNWKAAGPKNRVIRMINPTPDQIEELLKHKLVGFNCRRYDNHIMYARLMGYSNEQLFKLSQDIVNGPKTIGGSARVGFAEAYNLSYTDVYDYAKTKQSLKKWEIKLGIHHQELGLPWDKPVPEELWNKVAEYCDNDVLATEAVWNATQGDFLAREILADVANGCVNDSTNSLSTRIIFGSDKKPQSQFQYRFMGDGVEQAASPKFFRYKINDEYTLFLPNGKPVFPGYKFERGVSTYRGEIIGEGGYVYARPGMYGRTITLDVASMHPSTIIAEKLFGELYTARFEELKDARVAIKHRDFEKAKTMLGGKLAKFISEDMTKEDVKILADALKIVINSVYGLTSAKFANPFKHPDNVDNIVAKRGALFMVNLKHEVEDRGYTVVHIKTDSIKIADPDDSIMKFVIEYGKLYGYNFEIEHIFEKICLVNDAVYIAKLAPDDEEYDNDKDYPGHWAATGAQFAQPYVFKKLFSKEEITFEDMCETKEVNGSLYLDFNEDLGEDQHNYTFIGKVGLFCPIKEGYDGGILYREKDGKYYAASGTKGYRWKEAEMVKQFKLQDQIDISYYEELVNKAVEKISEFTKYPEQFREFCELSLSEEAAA